ncbi:MAG TPA: heparin lyase I family protein, partial [Tepidisphaeraceae bacterium]
VFQLKATDGDKGAPLVTLSLMEGTNRAALRYISGPGQGAHFETAREFTWKPGEWQTVRIRVKTTANGDGLLMASVNGDEFRGVQNVKMFRPDSTDYRPKWGFYRGVTSGMHDDWVEHKDAIARKLSPGDITAK